MENTRSTLKLAETPGEPVAETRSKLDARVLSSILIQLKVEADVAPARDAHARLAELTRAASIQSLLTAATNLAEQQNLPEETALRQIVADIFELNSLWNQVLLEEGVARLTSQYH